MENTSTPTAAISTGVVTVVLALVASFLTPSFLKVGIIWDMVAFLVIGIATFSFTYHYYQSKRLSYWQYICCYVIVCLFLFTVFLGISWLLIFMSSTTL
ncbi:hypothetical protein [Exiguobacterium sp. SRB7LM]|uniref:hypothetical protein n=1 Tax=Exiguobacterium sp. SRB7LM TaxID=2608401 RepID=UPI0018C36769|nr:hypothetical protein [Exiguobacterium sp. SRB7LM]MBG0917001.1 hypothetical protein [Exiguobacterium sp. SRB7LM]